MKYLFGRSLSRADIILTIIVSTMYASGSWTGLQTFAAALVGVILTSLGEYVADKR
jgi:hypothetical protein